MRWHIQEFTAGGNTGDEQPVEGGKNGEQQHYHAQIQE